MIDWRKSLGKEARSLVDMLLPLGIAALLALRVVSSQASTGLAQSPVSPVSPLATPAPPSNVVSLGLDPLVLLLVVILVILVVGGLLRLRQGSSRV